MNIFVMAAVSLGELRNDIGLGIKMRYLIIRLSLDCSATRSL